MKNNSNIRVEVLMDKLDANGKYGIKLPIKEKEAQSCIDMLSQLLEKGLLSGKIYDEQVKDINSRSLDEETYKEFYEVLQS
jgi:hypothetical protein